MTSAATYHRVPSVDQSFGPEDEKVWDLVSDRSWELVERYVDGIGAGKRRGLQKLLVDARRGRFEVLVVYRCDQLFRSVRDLLALVDELAEIGVDLVVVSQPIDSTKHGRAQLVARVTAFAQFDVCASDPRSRAGRPPAEFSTAGARELRRSGMTFAAIARELGVGSASVHRALVSKLPARPRQRSTQMAFRLGSPAS